MSTWKNVGMTYLKYADLCATHLRNALKEPAKSKAMTRSDMHARIMVWEDGKRGKPGMHPPRPSVPPPDSCWEAGTALPRGSCSGICMHCALFPGGGGGERWAAAMLLCARGRPRTPSNAPWPLLACAPRLKHAHWPSPPSHSCVSRWVAARRDCGEEGGSSGRMRSAGASPLCITLAPFAASFEGAILGASAPSASDVPSSFHASFHCSVPGIPGFALRGRVSRARA